MLATLTASATLTVRRRGLAGVLAHSTYDAPFVATVLVDLEPGVPPPAVELRARDGKPALHFRVGQAHVAGARLISSEIRERGEL